MKPPRLSMGEFCEAASEVLAGLPQPFHDWLENVVVDVEEAPSRELLREMGMSRRSELLGLFQGRAVTQQDYGEHAPNRILLFKRPIESICRTVEEVKYEIRRTVVHELAHHFGYSEEDLAEFESRPSPYDPDRDDSLPE